MGFSLNASRVQHDKKCQAVSSREKKLLEEAQKRKEALRQKDKMTSNLYRKNMYIVPVAMTSNIKSSYFVPSQKNEEHLTNFKDTKFQQALGFLFPAEGGYSNQKFDKGGATNMGITQATYNAYLKKNNLPTKDVKTITRNEAEKLYYDEFWVGSGASKISDPKMAVAYFDASVHHGPATAASFYKKSGGNLNQFMSLRQARFDALVTKDPTQKQFYNGWCNRIAKLDTYLQTVDNNQIKSTYQAVC